MTRSNPPAPRQRALLITTLAVPLTGWTLHATVLHRRLAATRRDPLTAALRRDAYTTRAQRLIDRHPDDALVVLADVDFFKAVNDTHGHAAGDRVLAATAARLTAWAGPHGVVGRLGGDEFAAATRIPPAHHALRLDQLATALAEPVNLDQWAPLDVAVSLGAAATATLHTTRLGGLQRAADAALYDGKHTGHPRLAGPRHTDVPSINGRRAGRPGTHAYGAAAA